MVEELEFPNATRILDTERSLSKLAGISSKQHLDFGDTADLSVFKYTEEQDGSKGVGEVNEENKLTGRGLMMYPNGAVYIGMFRDGRQDFGHYI